MLFGICTGSPDIFFNLFNGSGLQVYTSSVGSNSTSNSWSGLSIVVDNPPYSFTFWDEDCAKASDMLRKIKAIKKILVSVFIKHKSKMS